MCLGFSNRWTRDLYIVIDNTFVNHCSKEKKRKRREVEEAEEAVGSDSHMEKRMKIKKWGGMEKITFTSSWLRGENEVNDWLRTRVEMKELVITKRKNSHPTAYDSQRSLSYALLWLVHGYTRFTCYWAGAINWVFLSWNSEINKFVHN